MKRYQDIAIKNNDEGSRVVKPLIYPPIPKTGEDIYVRTTAGDRLDLLAYKYYGNVSYWWIIAEANGVGKGTVAIEPGTQLRIPSNPTSIMLELKNLNS